MTVPDRAHAKVELDDGQVFDVAIDQRDYIEYDKRRVKRGWGPALESPFLLQAVAAAAALIRQRDVQGIELETLAHRIVNVEPEAGSDIRPTPAVPGND